MSRFLEFLFIFSFIAALAVGVFLFWQSRRVEVPDTAVREEIVHSTDPPPRVTAPPTTTAPPEVDAPTPTPTPTPTPRVMLQEVIALREYYDNNNIIGFIEIPGTNISYPVVQNVDNEFYLYHDLRGNRSRHGSIFLDYENNPFELWDHNMIIYGHNMMDGSKFHNVRHYFQEPFFRDHNYILLTTPYRETVWDVFSFFHTHIRFCYLTTNFATNEAFYQFATQLQDMSLHSTDIELVPEDQILILSTCARTGGDYRYVLVARLRHCCHTPNA